MNKEILSQLESNQLYSLLKSWLEEEPTNSRTNREVSSNE